MTAKMAPVWMAMSNTLALSSFKAQQGAGQNQMPGA